VLWLFSFVLVARGTSGLLSDKGRDAASRWLGVRAFLSGDDAFRSLPPSAVAIWDRYLPYAAARGIAKDSARGLLPDFRTTPARADFDRAAAVARTPFAAMMAMPSDLRPEFLGHVGSAEPFGPSSDDFIELARGVVQGGPGAMFEFVAGA